jgi:hypothetical protein
MDPDPRGPKTRGSGGSGSDSATLLQRRLFSSYMYFRAEKYEGALTPALEGGTDLVPAQYEGGLKIWECSEDLVR